MTTEKAPNLADVAAADRQFDRMFVEMNAALRAAKIPIGVGRYGITITSQLPLVEKVNIPPWCIEHLLAAAPIIFGPAKEQDLTLSSSHVVPGVGACQSYALSDKLKADLTIDAKELP